MTHKIVERAPVGSQWKTKSSGAFFDGRTLTIVRHDMNEHRIRYVYDGDTREMSKSFDTFERELRQGNIRVVNVAPKAMPCRFQAGQFWESVHSACPLELGVRFEITSVGNGKVYYRYDGKSSTNFRHIAELEGYFESGWLIPAPVPAKKPEPKFTLKTAMEKPMTRIVNVFLMDKTAGLKANERMIGKIENFASDSNDNTLLLLELSMEHDLKGMLHEHNKRRKTITNQDILNRVGKTVYLQPIELKDVKIDVQVVTAV
ncbi:hypothetical protein QNH08_gp26 [Aeromonas phage pAh6.2TG]|uniref:Uncharacterized protein n=1 Tax=Aeromonas phage pAh6.2TG TaxID=2849625 RepID=A0A8F3C945_9CAUD|nr:hypothetical protein QNH08_gp26 [Aeromonas phage pAh6.2TG]QWY14058.1 hypothetical protein [Aeromonas phage pAh6.2TG]